MTWAHWVLILVLAAWAAFVVWIAKGGFDPDEYCDCRDCSDVIARLGPWVTSSLARLEQPVREACELTFDEEIAWQRIRAGS